MWVVGVVGNAQGMSGKQLCNYGHTRIPTIQLAIQAEGGGPPPGGEQPSAQAGVSIRPAMWARVIGIAGRIWRRPRYGVAGKVAKAGRKVSGSVARYGGRWQGAWQANCGAKAGGRQNQASRAPRHVEPQRTRVAYAQNAAKPRQQAGRNGAWWNNGNRNQER